MAHGVHALTCHIARSFELCCNLRHLERIAVQFWHAAIRTCGCLLSEQSCRSHLSTRHSINGVVDEDDCDVLAAVKRMYCLGSTDTSQVAVTLIGEHQTVGPQALDGGGDGWSTSVSGLLPVDVYITISENGTAYWRNAYRLLFHSHLLDYLCNKFMHDTMRASRAIVHGDIVHQRRLLIHQILWTYNLILFHGLHQFGFDSIYNLIWFGNDTSQTSKVFHRHSAIDGKTNVLDHLASIDFSNEHSLLSSCCLCYLL